MADKYHGGIKAGSTSVEVPIGLLKKTSDGTAQTGIAAGSVTAYYRRPGANPVAITVSALANLTDAWSSGGWKEYNATNQKGWYRLDVPDAAFATGVDFVVVTVQVAGVFEFGLVIPLESKGAKEVNDQATAIKAKTDNLPSALPRGQAATFTFAFKKASDPTLPATGITPGFLVRTDAGAFAAATNAPSAEIGGLAVFDITLTAAEMNGAKVSIFATGTGALPQFREIFTKP